MVRLIYLTGKNVLGETKEIIFTSFESAKIWIKNNKAGILKESAGYSIYSIVPKGEIPKTLFNYTR